MSPILSLQHLFVARGSSVVLHDVNLVVDAGEHIAILGPNGCGKSTLLKTLTCELYPLARNPDGSRPDVSIFGRSRWDLTELRRRLGVVSSDPLPGSTLGTSALNTILTGFFSSSTLWPNLEVTDRMRLRAEDLLHRVDAVPLRHRLMGELSAGQQRRILIARALAGSGSLGPSQPGPAADGLVSPVSRDSLRSDDGTGGATEMVLLDEPSTALDLAAQRDLRQLLRRLAQAGTAVLLITHHTADIVPEIRRVILMRGGRITADGPRRDLLTEPVLSELFGTELTLAERDGYLHCW